MTQDDLDRILSQEEGILPSSGFAASVMEAVQCEASTPPPIPFPWKRALPGFAAATLAFVLVFTEIIIWLGRETAATHLAVTRTSALASILEMGMSGVVGWTVLALILTLASVMLSMRLASGRT